MKNISRIIAVLFVLCTIGLFTACQEPDAVFGGKKIPAGYGTVYLSIAGTGPRTLFPADLADLDISLEAVSTDESSPVTEDFNEHGEAAVNLKAGVEWTITITVKSGATEVGAAESIKVTPVNKAVTQVKDIFIVPKTGGADGTLDWAVTYPAGTYISETITIGEEDPIDMASKKADTTDLAPGSYTVIVLIEKDGKFAGKTLAVHIYSGMTTELRYAFDADDFKTEVEYFAEDLKEDIGDNAAIGADKATVTVNADTTISSKIAVRAGVTLIVDTGKTLTIADGGTLVIERDSDVLLKGTLDILSGGRLDLDTWDPVEFANFVSEGTGKLILNSGSIFFITEYEDDNGLLKSNPYVYMGDDFAYAMWRLQPSGYIEITKVTGGYPVFTLHHGIETGAYGAVILPGHRFIVSSGSDLDVHPITGTGDYFAYPPGLWVAGVLEVKSGGFVSGYDLILKETALGTGEVIGWPPDMKAVIGDMTSESSWQQINAVNELIKGPSNIDATDIAKFKALIEAKLLDDNDEEFITSWVKESEVAGSSVDTAAKTISLGYVFSEVPSGTLDITVPAGLVIASKEVTATTVTSTTITYAIGTGSLAATVEVALKLEPNALYIVTFESAGSIGIDDGVIVRAISGAASETARARGAIYAISNAETTIVPYGGLSVTVTNDAAVKAGVSFQAVSKVYRITAVLDNDPVILRNFTRQTGETLASYGMGMLKSAPAAYNGDSVALDYPPNFDIAKYNTVRYTVFSGFDNAQLASSGYHLAISFFSPWDTFKTTTAASTGIGDTNGTVWLIANDGSSATPPAANAATARNGAVVTIPATLTTPPAGFRAQRRSSTTSGNIANGIRIVQIEFYHTSNPPVYTASTVSFDADGGTGGPAAITVAAGRTYVETLPATSTNPTNGTRPFLGWFTEKEGKGLPLTIWTPIFENTTFYAYWEPLAAVDEYTVTFSANHSDAAGATAPNPASKETTQGKVGTLPTAPTRSEGWGAGMTFVEWNTQADGLGTAVTADTPIYTNTTVFAKWVFTPGSPVVEGETLVIVAPPYETNDEEEAVQGTWHENNRKNPDGSVFFSGDAVRYSGGSIRFMWDSLNVDDYDFVVLSFVGERPSGTTTWMSFLNKKGRGSDDYTSTPASGAGSAGTTLAATGSVRFAIKNARYDAIDGYKSGIALQRNGNAAPPSGIGGTIKFTRAVFSKGTRYDVAFDAGYGGGETFTTIQAVSGVPIGPLPTPEDREGFKFTGWQREGTTTIFTDATSMPAANITLVAQWAVFKPTEPITVDFSATTMGVVGGASYTVINEGAGYEYTLTNYNQHAKFEVTLPEGFCLADYDRISFTLTGISGDMTYKNCNVPGGKTITAWSNPAQNNATNVTTAGANQNVLGTFPVNLVFNIAKDKTLNTETLTGTFELGVAINAGSSATTFRVENFRIYQVE